MRFMHGVAETEWIIAKANELGFDLCGIASAEGLADRREFKGVARARVCGSDAIHA